MKMKSLQAIDIEFSAVGFGCWAAGGSDIWNNTDDNNSIEAIRRAIELGVTFFDVAPVYGLGHAETILGKALGDKRQQVIIGSKCGLVWDEQGNISNNLSPESIMQEINDSLKRLDTEYIDIYQMHWPDPETPIADTMEALNKLKKQGKIRYIGVSNYSLSLTEEASQYGDIVSYQGLYNLFEHNPAQYHSIPLDYRTADEILPYCNDKGLAFFPYSPLFQGLLTDNFQIQDQFNDNDVRSANPKLRGELFKSYYQMREGLLAFATDIGKPLSQVAINWLINQTAVTSVICGAQTVAHVEENVGSISWELTSDMMSQIESILYPYQSLI